MQQKQNQAWKNLYESLKGFQKMNGSIQNRAEVSRNVQQDFRMKTFFLEKTHFLTKFSNFPKKGIFTYFAEIPN